MVVLLRLNRALIKDGGIEMHAATKQAFMFRWYFSTKVRCLYFLAGFFVTIFLSGRPKKVFSRPWPTAGSYFDPCNGLLFGPGNLRLTFFISNYKYVSVKCLCKVLCLFS